jgi:pyridoxine 5-phosphate synthase
MEPRLGVNIDHIATMRQLRHTPYPNLLEAAGLVERGGAHHITVHLREDRRHIQPDDVTQLREALKIDLNLEMAATESMTRFACQLKPDWVCLVPEKRNEVTTEGGLSLKKKKSKLEKCINKLKKISVRISLFIEPHESSVEQAKRIGADAIEFHTGCYARASQGEWGNRSNKIMKSELERILSAALLGQELGLQVHAGHGLDFINVRPLSSIKMKNSLNPLIEEFNIGHSIVCRSLLVGLEQATREMLSAILAP